MSKTADFYEDLIERMAHAGLYSLLTLIVFPLAAFGDWVLGLKLWLAFTIFIVIADLFLFVCTRLERKWYGN